LKESINLLNTLNHSRWTSPKSSNPVEVREQHLAHLRVALEEFKATNQFRILDNYAELFDERTGEPKKSIPAMTHASRNLFRCQVFTTTLSGFSDVLVEWLEMLLELEKRNPKSKFQFPGGGTKAVVEAANDKEGGGNPMEMGGENDDASSTSTLVEGKSDKEKKAKRSYRKSPLRDLADIQPKIQMLAALPMHFKSSAGCYTRSFKELHRQKESLRLNMPSSRSRCGYRRSLLLRLNSHMRIGMSPVDLLNVADV
jgi:hypothetical protein